MGRAVNIYDSYIEAGQQLGRRDREQFYTAVIEFIAYGVEPTLRGAAAAVFTAIRPTLEESRRSLVNGRKGGRPKRNPEAENPKTQTPENEKPKPRKTENPNAENQETQTAENGKPKGKGKGNKKEPPNGGSKEAHPTAAEVEAYAGEVGHPEFDATRFVDYHAAQGWRLSNGNPMKDWRATVRNWIRRDSPPQKAGEEAVFDEYADL